MMKISENGVDLITDFEGFVANAYLDPVGIWTVGFGSTRIDGREVKRGDHVTEEEALAALMDDIDEFFGLIEDFIMVELNQNQIDAIGCFVYNIGPEAFKKSTLLTLLNKGDFIGASLQFLRWNQAGGKVQPGLIRRRMAESKLFLEEDDAA